MLRKEINLMAAKDTVLVSAYARDGGGQGVKDLHFHQAVERSMREKKEIKKGKCSSSRPSAAIAITFTVITLQ